MFRLKELRAKKNISQLKLSGIIGVSRGTVAMWETGKSQPDNEMLVVLANYFNVSIDYLLGNDNKQQQTDENTQRHTRRIPIVGNSAAGIPIEAIHEYIDEDDPDTWEEISEELAGTGDFVAVRIKGDSMEPRMMDGDIVIVRVQNDVDSGETAIVIVNGDEAICKKIQKHRDGVMLVSNNTKYAPMFYSNKDIINLPVRIFGKVVEVRGKI